MTMMNNANENAASITRPVTMKDIAERLGLSFGTVWQAMSEKYAARNSQKTVELVRQTAKEMGYDRNRTKGYAQDGVRRHNETAAKIDAVMPTLSYVGPHITAQYIADRLGISVTTVKRAYRTNDKRSEELDQKIRQAAQIMGYVPGYSKPHKEKPVRYWHGGNFHTRQEEVAHMKELREVGYSNREIAKKVGRNYKTVLINIGKQDPELSKQNMAMAQKYRAQRAAARKQYVVNKPIREYNKRVKEHNDLKAKIAQMEMELKPQIPAIEKVAQTKIDFPMMQMETIQPVALQ